MRTGMLRRPPGGDRGQALPVYITVIGALLFLAFAFFAVGQAAVTRNGAQTAADAAALAAAQDRAGQLHDQLLHVFQGGPLDGVGQLLGGVFPGLTDSCGRAAQFARDNDARTTACDLTPDGDGYRVTVLSTGTVGHSVIPGTQNKRARAGATAELTPQCTWQAAPTPSTSASAPAGGATPAPTPTPTGTPPTGPGANPPSPGTLRCQGGTWTVDPANPTGFPTVADLFHVHLTS
ncbi:pilus assembly protein TadG-related protein [Streptantibioticus silvisoli]|uniref:Pilus assembly protein TadG-related protein n=1 Tax=Streptantibioticus silvisoli TaxID=2705255 RepID=A0ABT6W151_9ACTN|nr:pilus assembly protein TadG-related protein [Streptantibioticus silvisoli]MDI5963994.1 pilus assembly protein TadG-related protein [Streptantibioticus silvisoli]